MNILLFDGPERGQLLPFTFIRPVAQLRVGIDLLQDKWEAYLGLKCGLYTQDYLQPKFPLALAKETIEIDGSEYPLVKLEISRTSHPFYTGKTKLVDTAGRIDKFKNKYAKFKK